MACTTLIDAKNTVLHAYSSLRQKMVRVLVFRSPAPSLRLEGIGSERVNEVGCNVTMNITALLFTFAEDAVMFTPCPLPRWSWCCRSGSWAQR